MKTTMLACSMFLNATLSAADHNAAAERAVADAVAAFNQAARTGDGAKLADLLSDDLVYVHSTGLTENKAQCIATLVKSRSRFVPDAAQIVRIYGKAAYVQTKLVAHNVTDGRPTQISLILLQVWAKEGKGWRMVARQTARLAS